MLMWIALVFALLLAIGVTLLTRARRRPAALPREVQSMRLTLERKVREGADFRF